MNTIYVNFKILNGTDSRIITVYEIKQNKLIRLHKEYVVKGVDVKNYLLSTISTYIINVLKINTTKTTITFI